MVVGVHWGEIENTSLNVIYVHYKNGWSWDDFYDAMNTVERMTAEASFPVHFINDFTQSQTLPPSNLQHLNGFIRTLGEVGGIHILVKFGRLWLPVEAIINREYPHLTNQIFCADSIPDARHMLKRSV